LTSNSSLGSRMRDLETPPLGRFIWPALLLHAALVGVSALVPPGLGPVARSSEVPVDASSAEVQVEVLPQDRVPTEPAATDASRGSTAAVSPAPGRVVVARRSPGRVQRGAEALAPDVQTAEPGDAELVAPASSPPARADSAAGEGGPRLSLEQMGVKLGDAGRPGLPDRHAPTARSSPARRLQQSMAAQLEARDRKHGLGPQGPVIAALEDATRTESTPANGRAEFLVVIDEHRRVVSIEVLEVSGDFRAWQRAARRARKTLAGRRMVLPSGAKGVRMRLEVASRVQRPSGADPGYNVSLFGIPLQSAKGDRPSRVELFNPIPKLEVVKEYDPATGELKELPQVRIGFVPLLLGIDPSDIGAPTRRVVSGRVVDVQVM